MQVFICANCGAELASGRAFHVILKQPLFFCKAVEEKREESCLLSYLQEKKS